MVQIANSIALRAVAFGERMLALHGRPVGLPCPCYPPPPGRLGLVPSAAFGSAEIGRGSLPELPD